MRGFLVKSMDFFIDLLCYSGLPFAIVLYKLKELLGGTTNSADYMTPFIISIICGVVSWVGIIFGMVWVWNHVSISIN